MRLPRVAASKRRFQFTPLREGRQGLSLDTPPRALFQFTPLREGRPLTGGVGSAGGISIHAPARGATRCSWVAPGY